MTRVLTSRSHRGLQQLSRTTQAQRRNGAIFMRCLGKLAASVSSLKDARTSVVD